MTTTLKENKDADFVLTALGRMSADKGFKAALKKADNPSTEYMSWDYLASHNVALDKPHQRLPYSTVAAAMARAGHEKNGKLTLGRAIAICYPDGQKSKPAQARVRRLLACDGIEELTLILRPILSLINSRTTQALDYIRLLGQLKTFAFRPEEIKAQWAQEFYSTYESKAQ